MRIVLTHGRAQSYRIAGTLERLWEEALRDGLRAVGYPDASDASIHFAFYGDIWRPDRRALADAGGGRQANDADRGDDEGERGGEAAGPWDGERLVTTEPSLQRKPSELEIELAGELLPPDPDRERLDWDRLASLISDLDAALGVGKPLLAWFLKDLDEYFRDDGIRQRVLTTMRTALEAAPEQQLLLGHSMGSIVAYDLLASFGAEALGVRGLVTFGSPLGMASLHARVAERHPGTPYPSGLESWVNVYNEQDFATVVRQLAPLFPGGERGIVDVAALGQAPTLFDPGRGHDPITYLSSVGLAQAVADLLVRDSVPLGDGRGAGGDDHAEIPKARRSRSISDAAGAGLGWTRSKPPWATEGAGVSPVPDDGERGGGEARFVPPRRSGPGVGTAPDDGERGDSSEPASSGPVAAPVARNGSVAETDPEPMAPPAMTSPEPAPPEMAGPTPARPGMRTVERTASADFPPIVKPGSKHELRVAIAGKAVHAIEGRVVLEVPQDQEWLDLRVGVYAADFKVEATSDSARTWEDVRVNLDKPQDVAEATFRLTAARVKSRRDSVIYVTIYRGNLPVGQLSLFTAIDPAGEVRAAAITLGAATAKDPDYVLIVTDRSPGVKGAGPFDISVSKEGEFLNQPLGSFPVTIDAWAYARQRLEGFRQVKAEKTPEDRVRAAEALGLDIWWDLPDAFRSFYWSELHGKDVSIAIYSQEPYIPWELIRPQRERAGEEADFLGVSFRIARWRQALRFPDPLDVTGFAVIAPVYGAGSGSQPLPGAQLEAGELEQNFGARRLGGDRATVRQFLESGDGIQLLHFAGHGEFDPDAKDDTLIKLADEPLLPQDIHRAKVGRTARPFVVLNACEVGEEGWALTRIGGWAQAFTDVGFSGFVGPYWAVNDRIARKVANLFYSALANGLTVGEALREVRSAFYRDQEDRGHPSWLAYTLHCQPNVHIHMPKVPDVARPAPEAVGSARGGDR